MAGHEFTDDPRSGYDNVFQVMKAARGKDLVQLCDAVTEVASGPVRVFRPLTPDTEITPETSKNDVEFGLWGRRDVLSNAAALRNVSRAAIYQGLDEAGLPAWGEQEVNILDPEIVSVSPHLSVLRCGFDQDSWHSLTEQRRGIGETLEYVSGSRLRWSNAPRHLLLAQLRIGSSPEVASRMLMTAEAMIGESMPVHLNAAVRLPRQP